MSQSFEREGKFYWRHVSQPIQLPSRSVPLTNMLT
jgi:hypothetical protein